MATIQPQQRDALYYPYIHIRGDINWLKATLLCFPHVLRMVPSGFEVQDTDTVRPFCTTTGTRDEPLVGRVDLAGRSVAQAQAWLRDRLVVDLDRHGASFLARFSREAAVHEYKNGDSAFQIHREKFLELPNPWGGREPQNLLAFLEQNHLVWQPADPNRGAVWYGVHPVLGETIMSTIACAVAKDQGCDIVTNDGRMHEALTIASADAVYDTLILDRIPGQAPTVADTTDEIVQLVIVNHFDVSRLTVKDIAAMSREGDALYDFKQHVARYAAPLPGGMSPEMRRRRLEEAAGQVVDAWGERKQSMSKFARDFFSVGLLEKGSKLFEESIKSTLPLSVAGVAVAAGAAAAATSGVLAAVPGLAVGVVIYGAGIAAKHRAAKAVSLDRYLSILTSHGAVLAVAGPPTSTSRIGRRLIDRVRAFFSRRPGA